MRRKKTLFRASFLWALTGLLGRCAVTGNLPKTSVSEATFSTDKGMPLRYTISVPSSYAGDKPYPLLLALHYGGKVTPFFGKEFLTLLVEPALSPLEAIIVAPDCPAGSWDNAVSETAVMSLIVELETRYLIDRSKIIVTGYSLGAIGSWHLAAKHPEVFCAAIPISGMPPENTASIKIPVYVIHSRADEVFPFNELRRKVQPLVDRGAAVRWRAVDGLSHYATKRFILHLKSAIPWIREVWRKPALR